ncbi:N-acetyltransferase [Campylobacter sp. 9BO]|uniref:GNAT family N-acetyltransferase n=1 Tax=Campylobacter sp. 9BO TaxID=3424759 RepID=UPI003D324AC7
MILQAQTTDAKTCIKLLRLAMEDAAFYLAGTSDDRLCNEILSKFFTSEVNRISYKNVYVYKENSAVVGAMCVYFGGDLDILDTEILANAKALNSNLVLANECEEDEFYIDSIAVDEKFRGKGIASKLISHAFVIAKEKNHKKVSLIVDETKPKTLAFYESLGFKNIGKKEIYKHRYHHLIKEII